MSTCRSRQINRRVARISSGRPWWVYELQWIIPIVLGLAVIVYGLTTNLLALIK